MIERSLNVFNKSFHGRMSLDYNARNEITGFSYLPDI